MATRVDITSPSFTADPFPVYAEMRRNSPVCQVDPGGIWAVTRYDDVVQVLKDYQTFSSEGLKRLTHPGWLDYTPVTDAPALMDPPVHTRLRGFINRAFTTRVLTAVEPLIRSTAERLTQELHQECDFLQRFAEPVASAALCHLLGLDMSLQQRFKVWINTVLSLTPVAPPPERIAEIQAIIADGTDYMRRELRERRRNPRTDLLSTIAQAVGEEGGITEQEALGMIVGVMGGGLQTGAHLLALAMRVLLEHPQVQEQLRADRSLIPRFIEEVLRHQAPLFGTLRVTTREVELAGVRLPQGAVVYLVLGSANRDEKHFPDGERFNLDRTPHALLSFGHGVHFCVGAALGRLEGRLAFEVLLSRFSRFERRYERLEWQGLFHMRIIRSLPLQAVPAPRA